MQTTRSVALTTLFASLSLSTACVSKSKYEALEARLKETESTLAQKNKEADQLQSSLKTESAKSNDLNKKASNLEAKATSLEAKASTLEQKANTLEQTVSAVSKDKTKLQDSLSQVQSDNDNLRLALAEMEKNKAETDKRVAEYQNLLVKFKSMIDSGRLRVRIVDGRMVVALNSDLLFKSGSSNLTTDGTKSVQEVAGLLQTLTDKSFQIEGHTDNVAISGASKFANNWELAAARAISVLKKMVEAGMPEPRISAASYGESKPARTNETKEGRAANRRVEIVVMPDLSKLPGFEALNKLDATPTAK